MLGSKITDAPENSSFAAFMHLTLRRELKEDYVSEGGRKHGRDGLQDS